LEVAQQAFDQGKNRMALKAARRTLKVWPLSDYAGEAQYLVGRVYEARRMDERAFKEYQRTLTLYPRLGNYDEILKRQMGIADRFLAGQWFRVWGYVPLFRSMDRTARMYGTIVTNGPFHARGPEAQMKVGEAQEKKKDFSLAVRAYERAADRYYDQPEVAADALFKAGLAWNKQSKQADYDQSAAVRAIETLNQFKELYRGDKRVPEATQIILELKAEQARGAFATAQFYEKYKRYQGSLVYYNEVLLTDPDSELAEIARQRIEELRPLAEDQAQRGKSSPQSKKGDTSDKATTEPTNSDSSPSP
jgi:outer membrane protein assembly factor BamD (BamD/ComL family)